MLLGGKKSTSYKMITQIKIYFLKDQQFPVTSNFEDKTDKSEHNCYNWKFQSGI